MILGSKDNINNKKVVGKLRKTQLITTFGSGSIVDMPECSVIMAATDYWDVKNSDKLFEPNLQRLLDVRYFCKPKSTEIDGQIAMPDLPAYRFPIMHFCPKCNRLMPYYAFGDKKGIRCSTCGKELIPSRFLIACINGHIEDFPYKWWVHNGNTENCTEPNKLKIYFSSSSGGLGSIKIKCTACGKERTMEGCMGKDALKGYRCNGKRPWVGIGKKYNQTDKCLAHMYTLQRGASNVYFGNTQSALTIPPWSKEIQREINDKWTEVSDLLNDYNKNKIDDSCYNYTLEKLFTHCINSGKYSLENIKEEIKRRYEDIQDGESKKYSQYRLYEEEYRALSTEYIGEDEEQFKTERSQVPDNFKGYISEVMLVKRLREVLALKGFRRITPERPSKEDEKSKGINEDEYTSLSNEKLEWLPAIEMLGEGIFIKLNEERIEKWEDVNDSRYKLMGYRIGNDNIAKGKFSSRYVLLHTLSHLLIRQITKECGYSSSALKERIYSTNNDSSLNMAGILIYTSSSDSDGSLGGLVRQGESELLNNILLNLLQEASWCSSDPLCIESMNQGYKSLNYAACHACALLPETSCEARNCLLDRVAIVGKIDNRSIGYFGDMLEK